MALKHRLVVSLVLLAAMAVGGAAPQSARAATQLKVCGVVGSYVPATALLPGALTVGTTPFVIAAGATLHSSVALNANVCLDLTLGTGNQITGALVSANSSATLAVCGSVTAYAAATATAIGGLTINGAPFVVAVGTALPSPVAIGAAPCLQLTLNGFGQISRATAQANATSSLDICGTVTSYTAASVTSAGAVTISGRTFGVAVGTTLPASVSAGAELCMRLTLNGLAQVSGASVRAMVTSALEVCGQVTALTAAFGSGNGALTIGGTTRVVAAGTSLPPSIAGNAYLKLRLTLDGFARITDAAVLRAGSSLAEACGSSAPPSEAPSGPHDPGPAPDPSATADSSGTPDASAAPGPRRTTDPSRAPAASGPAAPGAGTGCPQTEECGGVAGAEAPGFWSQVLPDTASLGRAGLAVLQVSLPLLLLLAGLIGRELSVRLGGPAAAPHGPPRNPSEVSRGKA